jgi:hypothetical protein
MGSILKTSELTLYYHNILLKLESGFEELKEKYEGLSKSC